MNETHDGMVGAGLGAAFGGSALAFWAAVVLL